MRGKPYLIFVASQKGGVGKTTIALNLAIALIYQKFSVLLVDADKESASVSEHLGIKPAGKGYNEVLWNQAAIEEVIFAYQPVDLYVIPSAPSKELDEPKPDRYVKFYAKLRKLDYDFIIVDSSPGLFLPEIARFFNDVLIVTTPDHISAAGSAKMSLYCEKQRLSRKLLINRVGYSKFDLDTEDVEKLFGDVSFQRIPDDKIVSESLAKHKPAYTIDRYAPFSLAIEDLAKSYALKKGGENADELEAEIERKMPRSVFSRIGEWIFRM